jgi:antitoxin VapB
MVMYIHNVYTEEAMTKEYRAKVFKSGNSVALRLPKALGLKAGEEMVVREERGRFEFEPVEEKPDKIDLTGIYGSCPGLKPLSPEDRIMEPRELDWEGKLLKRD